MMGRARNLKTGLTLDGIERTISPQALKDTACKRAQFQDIRSVFNFPMRTARR